MITPACPTAATVPVSELPPGARRVVDVGDRRVLLINRDGEVIAVDERCTHAAGPLADGRLDGCVLVCAWHEARFDLTSGAVTRGPARKPLRTYPVRTVDGQILVTLEGDPDADPDR